jgi:hypothetical protein
MSDQKPDLMDGCGVSFWVVAGLVLLLAIPVGIRTCSDSSNIAETDELEQMQRLRKIEEGKAQDRVLEKQLSISLDDAMNLTLEKYGSGSTVESNASAEDDAAEEKEEEEQP